MISDKLQVWQSLRKQNDRWSNKKEKNQRDFEPICIALLITKTKKKKPGEPFLRYNITQFNF